MDAIKPGLPFVVVQLRQFVQLDDACKKLSVGAKTAMLESYVEDIVQEDEPPLARQCSVAPRGLARQNASAGVKMSPQ